MAKQRQAGGDGRRTGGSRRFGRSCACSAFDRPLPPLTVRHRPYREHQHHHARDPARLDHAAHVECAARQEPPGHERAQHRSGVVQSALQPEGAAAHLGRSDVGDQGVARRRTDPLADAVGHPQPDHLPGGAGQGDHRPHQHRDDVAEDDEAAAPPRRVGQAPGTVLDERRREFRRPVERAERQRAAAQHPGHERREQRVDHLAREIVEQRDEPEQKDRPGELTHPVPDPSASA